MVQARVNMKQIQFLLQSEYTKYIIKRRQIIFVRIYEVHRYGICFVFHSKRKFVTEWAGWFWIKIRNKCIIVMDTHFCNHTTSYSTFKIWTQNTDFIHLISENNQKKRSKIKSHQTQHTVWEWMTLLILIEKYKTHWHGHKQSISDCIFKCEKTKW